jgi:hypothetical protein
LRDADELPFRRTTCLLRCLTRSRVDGTYEADPLTYLNLGGDARLRTTVA